MTDTLLHYDLVGSFLRPERLKTARANYTAGKISFEALTKIEDEEIIKLIAKQKELGYSIVSDGEFRRSYWHLDFFWGFEGVEHIRYGEGYMFHDEETRDDSARLNGKIRFTKSHPFLAHFRFLKEAAGDDAVARVSIPAPAQLFAELVRGTNEEKTNEFYPNRQDLIDDLSGAYRESILAFYELGCRDLKLDDCTWAMLCDRDFWETMAGAGFDHDEIQNLYLELNNKAVRDLPSDIKISTHVCRGNYHSTYASSGGYEPVGELLFGKENVETYFLEFDDERSGNFEPLRYLSDSKEVVLGLVTSKRPQLEDKEEIKKRINEAAKYVPLERLALSPQCGFASTEEGNILTEEDQWKKMKLVKEIADEVWG
ncbi:MAG: 5-methyltetrahydropteroyltriglutamate--homocysteine S-methyltransferase [Spirochaetales bacterium]|nr:5-methyltetrahydropteroyltriglutamate--homocysteine S-methyltransferase [Spirochaetales bacterium]